jgi:ubiquinone/menaquinone biosynthesis C-methylase UbiE
MDKQKQHIKDLYDNVITKYYDSFNSKAGKYYINKKMKTFINYLPSQRPEGLKLLEVGSADGVFTEQLSKLGYETYSIDFSLPQIEKARMHCNDKVVFVNADGESLSFKPNSFDIIISMCTVRYFSNPEKAILHWYDLLRPNGVLIIDVPNSLCPFFWGLNRVINFFLGITTPKMTKKFSPIGIRRIFSDSGLENIESKNILLVYRWLSDVMFFIIRFVEKVLEYLPGGKIFLALIVCKGVKRK